MTISGRNKYGYYVTKVPRQQDENTKVNNNKLQVANLHDIGKMVTSVNGQKVVSAEHFDKVHRLVLKNTSTVEGKLQRIKANEVDNVSVPIVEKRVMRSRTCVTNVTR